MSAGLLLIRNLCNLDTKMTISQMLSIEFFLQMAKIYPRRILYQRPDTALANKGQT